MFSFPHPRELRGVFRGESYIWFLRRLMASEKPAPPAPNTPNTGRLRKYRPLVPPESVVPPGRRSLAAVSVFVGFTVALAVDVVLRVFF